MTDNQKKLVNLLKEMFQFDQADLDFGIYRIMKLRRDEISRFIEHDLPEQITEGLQELSGTSSAEKIAALDKKIAEIKNLGLDADVEAAQLSKFKAKKKSLENSTDISAVEADVYNHLTNFFGRYYDDGDFISQRRYKDGVYAIPYEGEEVKLYWANADQYYVKTSEYFKDYTFKTDYGETIHFKLVEAETDKDNNKSNDKRFFQLHEEKPFEVNGRELFIYMEYKTGDKKKQDDYIADVVTAFTAVSSQYPNFALIVKPGKDGKTELERQLTRYTARNTFDYFIHKDLKKFLNRELDFYIKNDVIFLDDIEEQDEAKTNEYLTKAKVIRKIARKIIDFLAQIEDFEKKLYLKKKFVVETNYCITLDRVPEKFYPEIAANETQRKEWVRLFAINEIEGNLTTVAYSEPLTVEFLKANPFLVLDTAFFSDAFKEKLIDEIDDLDEKLDGLMIHSENFQAVQLLRNTMHDRIKCLYLDPPYNTNEATFIYKNNYKHSSWASMIFDRISVGYNTLSDDGVFLITIDDEELYDLKEVIDAAIGAEHYIGTIVIQSNPRGRGINSFYATCHEYCLCYAKNPEITQIVDQTLTEEQEQAYNNSDDEVAYRVLPFRRSGGWSTPQDRPNSEFSLFFNEEGILFAVGGARIYDAPAEYVPKNILVCTGTNIIEMSENKFNEKYPKAIQIMPIDTSGVRRVWRWSDRNKILIAGSHGDFILKTEKEYQYVQLKDRIKKGRKPKTIWTDSRYDSSSHGTNLLKNMFGERYVFGFPKSVFSTEDSLHTIIGEDENAYTLDLFGGSGTTGHAVINLNRADGGHRKYILVEMGEYFDTVTRPRIEKVVYSEDWKDGKPVSRKGSSHAFKYLRLESYEDALNNISLTDYDMTKLGAAKEEYFLSYMLNTESDGSVSLLNVDKLDKPFSYKMNITRNLESKERTVDLVETFNYLIGLKVERSYALASFDADFTTGEYGAVTAKLKSGKAYKIKMVEGTLPSGERALVIWREMTGDVVKDNAVLDAFFLRKKISTTDFEYRKIYVNCDNNLQNVRTDEENWKVILIEEEMKKRMFESVE
jgi:adenine-specific DNA-methyltransferase